MAKIVDARGRTVAADNPERALWYSAHCCYWTDDWDKLKVVGKGIPVCPSCDSPGMQISADEWDTGAKTYEEDNHPGYVEFLQSVKEQCHHRESKLMDLYEKHRQAAGGAKESAEAKTDKPVPKTRTEGLLALFADECLKTAGVAIAAVREGLANIPAAAPGSERSNAKVLLDAVNDTIAVYMMIAGPIVSPTSPLFQGDPKEWVERAKAKVAETEQTLAALNLTD